MRKYILEVAKRIKKYAESKIKEKDEAQLKVLASLIEDNENWLNETSAPTKSDYEMLGQLIQAYCIADFNARRVVNSLRSIYIHDGQDFSSRLNDADVLLHLRKYAAMWHDRPDVKDGIERATNTLEMHRIHRHHFAHWVVRRARGANAFIMLTKNAKEAERRDGKAQGIDQAKWGLVMIPGLQIELKKLKDHSDYLGKLAVALEGSEDQLRESFLNKSSDC